MTDLTWLQPVVLCGGSGTRLWPASRQSRPKQFLPLVGKASLFQATLERFAARVTGAKPPLVVGSTSHQSTLEEQLSAAGLLEARKILEPVARNSGPAVLAAALVAAESDPATPLLIMPSDHAIGAVDLFRERIAAGLGPAGQGRIVTFGLTPDSPHTGYGYLQAGDHLTGEARGIRRFREKPDSETAQALLNEGGWFWNGGIFLFRADVMLAEARRHAPEMLDAVEMAVQNASRDGNSVGLEVAAFSTAPSLSIDYAVMERSDRIAMVAMDGVGWSDLGDWNAIWQASNRTAEGLAADGPLYAEDARNCLIKAGDKPVALVGVEDLAVIDTPDVLLVVRRDRAQDVKAILAALRAAGREDLL